MSIRVRFRQPNGTIWVETDAPVGSRLLEVAQGLGLPLEGTCEGAMACSTCHVIVARVDFARLSPPSAHEEDMLDFTAHVTGTSRLACQIELEEGLGSLDLTLPPGHHDAREI
jgi:ferredoxin